MAVDLVTFNNFSTFTTIIDDTGNLQKPIGHYQRNDVVSNF